MFPPGNAVNAIFRVVVTITFVLFLGGCAPIIGDYYSPSAPEGKVGGWGDNYTPATLYLKRGKDVQVDVTGIYALNMLSGHQAVEVELWIRPRVVLNIDVGKIAVFNESSEEIARLDTLTASSSGSENKISIEVGNKILRGGLLPSKYWTVYSLYYLFNSPPPKIFYVRLPEMETDSVLYPPITIQFEKTRGWWLQTLM